MPSRKAYKYLGLFTQCQRAKPAPRRGLVDEMLIKLFVLHNEPMGYSLFLVNFKQAGQSEFVLTLRTPKCLLSLSDLLLIFSEMESFFFLFPHIFLKDTD